MTLPELVSFTHFACHFDSAHQDEMNLVEPKVSVPSFVPAAVLIPIVWSESGAKVMLTVRSNFLPTHAGQVSFPGGKSEGFDLTVQDTAIREANEELGLEASDLHLAGCLENFKTLSGFEIAPVLAILMGEPELMPNAEVAEVFYLPLDFVLDVTSYQDRFFERDSLSLWVKTLPYGSYDTWGVTAGILFRLALAYQAFIQKNNFTTKFVQEG